VSLAVEAADKLAAGGVKARVVSLPSLELFLQQPESYQQGLVPDDGTPLVAVEAALGESLRRLVGRRGLIHGMKGFGASAPYAKLGEHFGFTPEALADAVKDHVAESS
jgi:transketolase